MNLTLNARRTDDVVILDLAGRFVLGEPTLLIRDLMRDYLERGDRKFIFNLAGLTFMDSAGLGAMIETHIIVQAKHGNVVLLNLTSRMEGLFQVTRLSTVFQTFKSEADALAALR